MHFDCERVPLFFRLMMRPEPRGEPAGEKQWAEEEHEIARIQEVETRSLLQGDAMSARS